MKAWLMKPQTLPVLACWVKFSGDDILKYFSHVSQKTGFSNEDSLHKISKPILQTIYTKCLSLFSGGK